MNHTGRCLYRCAAFVLLSSPAFAWGCGCEEDMIDWDGLTGDASDAELPDGAETADLPDDAPPGEPDLVDFVDDRVCDEQDFRVHHELVRVMLLLDQSSSMQGSKWAQATDALTELLQNDAFYDMHFGLDAFPDGFPGFWSDCGAIWRGTRNLRPAPTHSWLAGSRTDHSLWASRPPPHAGLALPGPHGTTIVVHTLPPRGRSLSGAGVKARSIVSPRTSGQ